MDAEHVYIRNEVYPSWFVNALNYLLSVYVAGFTLVKQDATHIAINASANAGAATIAIQGRWRWMESVVSRAHPGGAAGAYDIFVTAADTVIVSTPAPYTDTTNYSFALAIVAAGTTPAIVAGTVDIFRKVGSLDWDGAQITKIYQQVPSLNLHAYSHATGQADQLVPSDIGAAAQVDLTAEITNRTSAVNSEATTRAAADTAETNARSSAVSSEASTRAAADTAETNARTAGDQDWFTPVAQYDDQTTLPPGVSVVGSHCVTLSPGKVARLRGVRYKCATRGSTPSSLAIYTDHGAHGTLTLVSSTGATPAAGGYIESLLATPMLLADGDEVAVVATTPGNSLGVKFGPVIAYSTS